VSIPPLTKDKRVQYVKLAKDYCEKTKARHRNFPAANAPSIRGVKRLGTPKSFKNSMPIVYHDFPIFSESHIEIAIMAAAVNWSILHGVVGDVGGSGSKCPASGHEEDQRSEI